MTARHNRSELRKADADIKKLLAARAVDIETIDQLTKENAKLKKHVQILYKRSTRVPDEMKACECGAKDPRPSHSSRTGFVCYNCGGECESS